MNKSRTLLYLLIFTVWLSLNGSRQFPQQEFYFLQNSSSSIQSALPAAPIAFDKVSPVNGAVNQPTSDLILTWNASSPNVTYEYCLRTNNNCPKSKWISVGADTSVTLQGLASFTTYYWQVRAVDASNSYTYANGGAMWHFRTINNVNLPGPFNKLTPTDAQTDVPISGVTLTWSASTKATSYEYCYDTNNNNSCDSSWTPVNGLTANIVGLAYETTYYWQVQAINSAGIVQADYGTWYSFSTQLAPPMSFGKTSPANFAFDQPLNLTLTWKASLGTGITYEYCLTTSTCTSWLPAGTNLSANLTNLQYATTYFWQVRAVNSTATVYADNGDAWSFSTPIAPPSDFGKISPGINAVDQPLSLVLSWDASSGTDVYYEYCLTSTTCSASDWVSTGTSLSQSINGLSYGTIYTWQVRAVNPTGTTYADHDTVWQFTTKPSVPEPFGKLSPDISNPINVPLNTTLLWSTSVGASHYYFCFDTVSHLDNDNTCSTSTGSGWVLNNSTESNHLSLAYNTTYYWQVYADNSQGTILADNGIWWSFKTVVAAPADFTKIAPMDGAMDQPLKPWLYWWTPANPDATYEYCLEASSGCPGDHWTSVAENAPIQITTTLTIGTTYYWQVRSTTSGGTTYANAGAEWAFTTLKTPPTSSDQQFSTPESTPLSAKLAAQSNYGMTFSLYGNKPAGDLVLSGDGSFMYTPVQYFNGDVYFWFMVSDGYNPPVGPFKATITMTPVNNPPVLASITDQFGENGKQLIIQLLATDPDLPYGDHLTYSVDETLPSGASINSSTGLFVWMVSPLQGSHIFTFTMRVTDSAGLSSSRTVKITINSHFKLYFPFTFR